MVPILMEFDFIESRCHNAWGHQRVEFVEDFVEFAFDKWEVDVEKGVENWPKFIIAIVNIVCGIDWVPGNIMKIGFENAYIFVWKNSRLNKSFSF